ncbi:GIY-YIG nuclease family protein [Marinomonas ostreistagni]|uniref:GIY-YIG nuclease family protein n=1 Tax=Marinomonas ostreistagni TaxID=359209 RepID=UPI00194F89FC|nr:GIY-YIG nuclease family protein [Marinomonas ostreistagni]MBM6549765.1 GIY-YIG nuclease family protein [Marinomonas ostreistagni]
MVVFKITNNVTGKHYIGTSFNSGFQRFEQYVEAANENLDFPLYEDIRQHGVDAFSVEELYDTNDKEELYELEQDYLVIYNAESLRGYKIGQTTAKGRQLELGKKAMFDTNGKSTAEPEKKTPGRKPAAKTAGKKSELPKVELPKKEEPKPTVSSFFGELIGEDRLDTPASGELEDPTKPSTIKRSAAPAASEKAASSAPKGTTRSSSSIQKMLREAEKQAKAERAEELRKQQQEQADEMALIMAKLDMTAKSAQSAFRRRKG